MILELIYKDEKIKHGSMDTCYYDKHGRSLYGDFHAGDVYSVVTCNPHNFNHYYHKKIKVPFSTKKVSRFLFAKKTTTLGGWMFPEGMPLTEKGEADTMLKCLTHAEKIKSDWFSSGRYLS
jgi:hypothetical protein